MRATRGSRDVSRRVAVSLRRAVWSVVTTSGRPVAPSSAVAASITSCPSSLPRASSAARGQVRQLRLPPGQQGGVAHVDVGVCRERFQHVTLKSRASGPGCVHPHLPDAGRRGAGDDRTRGCGIGTCRGDERVGVLMPVRGTGCGDEPALAGRVARTGFAQRVEGSQAHRHMAIAHRDFRARRQARPESRDGRMAYEHGLVAERAGGLRVRDDGPRCEIEHRQAPHLRVGVAGGRDTACRREGAQRHQATGGKAPDATIEYILRSDRSRCRSRVPVDQ